MYRHGTSSLKPIQALVSFVLFNLFSTAALACPLCHTDTGEKVRAGIFGPDFGFNLVVTIIPFIIFLAITALIYFGLPTRGNRAKVNKTTAFSSGGYAEGETM
jgi:hypothetical protein